MESFKVNGVEVKVEVDRGAVAPGDDVHLRIVAFADKPQRLGLIVRERENDLEPMERVESVPKVLSKRSVTVEAAPGGGKPTELTFKLPRSRGKQGGVSQYSFLVEPKKQVENEDGEMAAAMINVLTQDPEAYSVKIEPPANLQAGKPFDVQVRVKNTSKKRIEKVFVQLSPAPDVNEITAMGDQVVFQGSADDWTVDAKGDVEDGGLVVESLWPGEERVLTYHVAPEKPLTRFPVVASAYSEGAGNAIDWSAIEVGSQVAQVTGK